jgi:cell wall-associated NlpC family hydrolase
LGSTARRATTVLALILSLGTLSTLAADTASADPVASKRQEAARIAAQLEKLSERASVLTEDYNEARVKATDLDQRARNAAADLAVATAKTKLAADALKQISVGAYIRGGLEQNAKFTGSDPARAQYYLHTATRHQKDSIDSLHAAKQQLAEQQGTLASARDKARRVLAQVDSKRKAAAAAEAAERALLAKVNGDIARLVAAEQSRRANTAPTRSSRSPSRSRNIGTPPAVDVPAPNAAAQGAVNEAKAQLGKPYHYGASGPDSFDCSGLTAWAWRHGGGKSLPHSSRAQYGATSRIALNDIAPGDLVFFGSSVGSIHHVGIYVGGGKMIDAPETGRSVQYAYAFRGDLVGVGRVN